MVAPVRWATPATDVACAVQPACSARRTIQSTKTPPPWPPRAMIAMWMLCGFRGLSWLIAAPPAGTAPGPRPRAIGAPAARPAHGSARVVHLVGLVESGAGHGGVGHLAAMAAGHAVLVHAGHRVGFERIAA